VIEMRNSLNKSGIGIFEWIFYLVGLLLLFLLAGLVVNGQSEARHARTTKAQAQAQQPLYTEYRSVRLGMTPAEVRAKLGEPAMKSNEQDFYVFSANETAQVAYDAAQKVVTISIDYAGGVGAPDYKSVVGEGLLQRPDGSVFRMVMYDSERFWVSYNKSAATVPTVTITIGAYK
jgi:outer membrane protein assembly factor BamE (lipoprotein component of BamABCDE complex)